MFRHAEAVRRQLGYRPAGLAVSHSWAQDALLADGLEQRRPPRAWASTSWAVRADSSFSTAQATFKVTTPAFSATVIGEFTVSPLPARPV